jgi:hypothetical protein
VKTLKILKITGLEKFRKVYIKQKTSKNLNERDKYTVLYTNPPTPNSLVQTPHLKPYTLLFPGK